MNAYSILVFAVLAVSSCAPRQHQLTPVGAASRLPGLAPCRPPGVDETLLCGKLLVPENPASPSARQIPIAVVVLPALRADPRGDPWVEIAGGPGNAATDYARAYTTDLRFYRNDRDVLLIDQRGMGGSNGLMCDELDLYRVTWLFSRWPAPAVAACRQRMALKADLTQYSTERAADDLESVRKWLGYRQLNLFAYSYGTRLALTYMNRHPARVRSAILWGVVPPDFRRPLSYAGNAQRALDRLLEDCFADAACAQRFPRVREDLAAVLQALEQRPVPARITHPVTRASLATAITRIGFANAVMDALSYPSRAHQLPLVISRAAAGDFVPFLELDVATSAPRRPYYNAAHLSIVCPEETMHIDPQEVDALHQGTFMSADHVREYMRACEQWDIPPATSGVLAPLASSVPTLIVSGWMDPFTPPELGERVAAHLPHSRHLVVRHLSHEADGTSPADCLDTIFVAFLSNPDPIDLDVTCANAIRPPAFTTGQ